MKLVLSHHAKKRMDERGISFAEIRSTMNEPDYTVRRPNQEIEAHKKIRGKILKIVYVDEIKYIKIITLYYLR